MKKLTVILSSWLLSGAVFAGGFSPVYLMPTNFVTMTLTGRIIQNFAGQTREITPIGGALVREYADSIAATTGNIELGNTYNCSLSGGVWMGRDIADVCAAWFVDDTATAMHFYGAVTGAAGTAPSWVENARINMQTGAIYSVLGFQSGSGTAAANSPSSFASAIAGDYISLVQNNSANAAARAYVQVSNGAANAYAIMTGTGYTPSGAVAASQAEFWGTGVGGVSIGATNAGGIIQRVTGGTGAVNIYDTVFASGRSAIGSTSDNGVDKLQVTGTVLASAGYRGTSTNDNAGAGVIGEYSETNLAQGAAISLTTATPATIITSPSLGAGDWDIEGVICYHSATGTTNITDMLEGTNTTAATVGAAGTYQYLGYGLVAAAADDPCAVIPTSRYSLAAGTVVYAIAKADFTVSTLVAYGRLRARRVR